MDKFETAASLLLMLDEADKQKAVEYLRQLAASSTQNR
jgi:hypothetical protein